MFVSDNSWLRGVLDGTDLDEVYCEPGEDKFIFANDIADWVLARSDAKEISDVDNQSKL